MKYDIQIDRERCKGCLICIELCQSGVLDLSKDQNRSGYPFPRIVKLESCNACGMCEMFCPDFAIWVTATDEKTVE